MGKKITLDFSKVEERSGWNSKEMPEGLHEFKVELVDLKDANDGTAMWTYGLRPTNPKYKTRLFPYYCKLQQNQLFKLRDLFTAAGIAVPKKRTSLDPEAPVGKIIAAELSDATGNYAGRSEIDGVYDRSIIEDDDQVDDDDEVEAEDDEEYDEDEVEEGEEEVDDEELREEIEAEELGEGDEEELDEEDDLDDEDLDDEELEDEEFDDEEDEEEEPEPAPSRRAAKPAAEASAKAAPARRTIKRR